ncbi:bacteriodes thetaiotaomicron symbiotic chitinase [Cercophora samala]|uniref:chitinase n=1 Tax=Cercophora samala TaxID=330535 RepID=A0AA39ZFB8_9PEZI|nr:bacteriodes thetaiotaomicron symbiotic chitinase [Cercophora samala]
MASTNLLRVLVFVLLFGVLHVFGNVPPIDHLVRDPRALKSSSFFHRRLDVLAKDDVNDTSLLPKRDDYTCAPGRPCKNGACCGKDGFCGYGPTYCGSGCSSNCGATAECGRYSKIPGTTCPLNTCCSQHGFCGTTSEFCTTGCQSNCIEHPAPPGGGGGKTLGKVIGYWEAWNDRSKCHQTSARDLPIDGLTHINYAFAYIDPSSFEITTMDAQTPAKTFQDVVDLKGIKPSLQIYVSIGGWTFSDNGTATQPVFGNIARTAANRDKFARALLKFMNQYGFDGADLDWEYPGAPDRGGKPDDTKNYVELFKTLREAFDKSGRKLGLTFTAPSSYWYLKWFDLPGLMKYADWLNLMSYDLHGVWDRDNPIGNIVQGHTNLTEIKLACELLWRVNIPPSQVALGFGFYGRAFTLENPSCTKPGCPFKGGAKKGVCTGTSGYLAHYEIQDILSKQNKNKRAIQVIHDKEAAVKYFSWDNDQWISFDDKETFAQKIKWADSLGLSGSLIWASDLDDYDNNAHKALTGNDKIGKRGSLEQVNDMEKFITDTNSFLGQGCEKLDKVEADLTAYKGALELNTKKELVGYDASGCEAKKGKTCGKPIVCPISAGFKDKCMWRGSGGDCNGQCHEGEIKIAGSSWGGSPGESGTNRCSRGGKQLCCQVGLDKINDGCYWTEGCGKHCKADEEKVAYATDIHDKCWRHDESLKKRSDPVSIPSDLDRRAGLWGKTVGNDYCCPKSKPIPYKNCRWVGSKDCAVPNCERHEIFLATNDYGDADYPCNWWRKRALCCEVNEEALNPVAECDTEICSGLDGGCEDPDYGETDDGADYPDGKGPIRTRSAITSRALAKGSSVVHGQTWYAYRPDPLNDSDDDVEDTFPYHTGARLESRLPSRFGTPRSMLVPVKALAGSSAAAIKGTGELVMKSLKYRTGLGTFEGDGAETVGLRGGFRMAKDLCAGTVATWYRPEVLPKLLGKLRDDAEHLRDFSMVPAWARKGLELGKLNPQVLLDIWHKPYPANIHLPQLGVIVNDVKGWTAPVTPNDRIFTIMGSIAYRAGISVLPNDMNKIKMALVLGNNPMAPARFHDEMGKVLLNADIKAAHTILGVMQKTFGVFSYMNSNDLARSWEITRGALVREFQLMETFMGLTGAAELWKQHEAEIFARMTTKATSFMLYQLREINALLGPGSGVNLATNEAARDLFNTATELNKLMDPKLGKLVFHYDIPLQD